MLSRDQPVLYTVDLQRCTAIDGLTSAAISRIFVDALKRAGATVVESLTHDFPGAGLTCVLILAESHAVLHTWPETGTINIDIFSCSTRLKSLIAIGEMRGAFGAADLSIRELTRADGRVAQTCK
jgi:S-adenosylmethionine decarboxylase proenzyme